MVAAEGRPGRRLAAHDDDPQVFVARGGRPELTTTILTTASTGEMASIHDRVPVILTGEDVSLWLDPTVTDPAEALAVLGTGTPELTWHEVSSAVGSPRNNSPELVEPVGA